MQPHNFQVCTNNIDRFKKKKWGVEFSVTIACKAYILAAVAVDMHHPPRAWGMQSWAQHHLQACWSETRSCIAVVAAVVGAVEAEVAAAEVAHNLPAGCGIHHAAAADTMKKLEEQTAQG